MNDLVFLTRLGCTNTARMRASLDEAFRALGAPPDYQFIDLATLAAADSRIGYPTPTVLHRDRDLFGLATPAPPFHAPT